MKHSPTYKHTQKNTHDVTSSKRSPKMKILYSFAVSFEKIDTNDEGGAFLL